MCGSPGSRYRFFPCLYSTIFESEFLARFCTAFGRIYPSAKTFWTILRFGANIVQKRASASYGQPSNEWLIEIHRREAWTSLLYMHRSRVRMARNDSFVKLNKNGYAKLM